MRGVSRLSCLAVMFSLVSGQDRPCGAWQRCVSASSCQSFTVEKLKFDQLTPGSEEKRRLLKTLRSLVCNKKERKVCCEDPDVSGPDTPSHLPSLRSEECGLAGDSFAFVLGGEKTHVGKCLKRVGFLLPPKHNQHLEHFLFVLW